jgi:aryl-alcohol dehydrogenase-like predicted oxidoreductase
MASREATWRYRDDHDERFARAYWRVFGDAVVSSIGVGTRPGEATDDADERYRRALTDALEAGANVVDTAPDFRAGRSEPVVGDALAAADVEREQVVLGTKGGIVPAGEDRDAAERVRETYVDPGVVDADEVVGGRHTLAPAVLDDQLDRSLDALGVDAVDCYYLQTPETQLRDHDPGTVYDRIEAAFELLERRGAAGDLTLYGVATWEAFRVEPDHERHLSLPEVVRRARAAAEAAGGEGTRFRAVQLPFNVEMADAFTVDAHEGADGPTSALWFAREAGIDVFATAPLQGGALADGLPGGVAARLEGETPAQRALNFARSAPGVTAALVGTGSPGHVAENVGAGEHLPMGADAFDATFE